MHILAKPPGFTFSYSLPRSGLRYTAVFMQLRQRTKGATNLSNVTPDCSLNSIISKPRNLYSVLNISQAYLERSCALLKDQCVGFRFI